MKNEFSRQFNLLTVLFLFAASGCGKGPDKAVRNGRMIGRVYTNSYFGISLTAPAGWHIMDRDMFKQTMQMGQKIMSKAV